MKNRSKIAWIIVLSVLLLAAVGVLIGFLTGVLYFPPKTDPTEAAASFLGSIIAGDAGSANAVLVGDALTLPDDSDAVQQLLAGSYAWVSDGECTVVKYHAELPVTFTAADLTALSSALDEPLVTLLGEQVQNNPKKETYDDDLNYLPEVFSSVFSEALSEVLAKTGLPTREVHCTLTLDYDDGVWYISVPDAFLEALCGFTASGSDVPASIETYMTALEQTAADTAPYIRKTYALEKDCIVAPEPDPDCYGTTTDNSVIQSVIDDAAELLDGQATIWTPDVQVTEGYHYTYYRDDTILVIAWKEMIDGKSCTCAEVKIADPSQIIRKFAGDAYSSGSMLYCSEMAEQVNAVFASNADFYYFRQMGIVVYQGVLYRCNTLYLDTCFIDYDGNQHFVKAGTFKSREEVEQYILDNNIDFSLAFGPTLIEDGEYVYPWTYAVGQIDDSYSRSSIGFVGDLHYFFLTINFDSLYGVSAAPLYQLAKFVMQKGITNAYALDGGHTSELYMNGAPLNRCDWGTERQVSDILAFVTAIPESDR